MATEQPGTDDLSALAATAKSAFKDENGNGEVSPEAGKKPRTATAEEKNSYLQDQRLYLNQSCQKLTDQYEFLHPTQPNPVSSLLQYR